MDPDACLRRAAEALAEGDLAECRAALADYRDWRRRGGFGPEGGDDKAARLSRLLREAERRQQGGGRAEPRPGLEMDRTLRESMHRLSARSPEFFGHYLARLRLAEGVAVEEQARALGLTESALAALAMCKVPRAECRDEDLAAVANHVGLTVEALAELFGRAGFEATQGGGS